MPVDRATLELFVPLDRGARPLRAQLEDAICAAITGGGAPPGTRLPASRVLAEALGVSRGVVSEAYAQIAAEGWIEIRHGAAPVVRAVPAADLKGSDPRPFTNGKATPGRTCPVRSDLRATAPDCRRFRGGRGRPRCGASSPRCPMRCWTTAIRWGMRSCEGVDRVPRAGARGGGDGAKLVVTRGYTQALWLTCRALAARGCDDGRGRGPVAG